MKSTEPHDGDMGLIRAQVKCHIEYSNEIVSDFDEDGEILEMKGGLIVKIPEQTIIYSGEEFLFMANATRFKP